MLKSKCLLFDCMETVVDIVEKPDLNLYAWWAYNGSGYEYLWDSFNSFVIAYNAAKTQLELSRNKYEEYNIFERFRLMLSQNLIENFGANKVITAISQNYWYNYKANCFVDETVKSTLSYLCSNYKCGIVSNFMVEGGIEELLKIYGIDQYFDFVVTSINVGWRKPHPKIYDTALEFAKVQGEQVLFIGDNYICDYDAPVKYGFQAVSLDKDDVNRETNQKIKHIKDLVEFIK